jgi:hypothetical protein
MERWGSTTRDPPNAASPVNGAVENQPKDDSTYRAKCENTIVSTA